VRAFLCLRLIVSSTFLYCKNQCVTVPQQIRFWFGHILLAGPVSPIPKMVMKNIEKKIIDELELRVLFVFIED
jgi:hypothetical protein